jgi:hypothetical protein
MFEDGGVVTRHETGKPDKRDKPAESLTIQIQ